MSDFCLFFAYFLDFIALYKDFNHVNILHKNDTIDLTFFSFLFDKIYNSWHLIILIIILCK